MFHVEHFPLTPPTRSGPPIHARGQAAAAAAGRLPSRAAVGLRPPSRAAVNAPRPRPRPARFPTRAHPPRAAPAPRTPTQKKNLLMSIFLCIFAALTFINMSKENIDPQGLKKWIAIIIAILSAIAGALGESATNFITNTLG